METTKRRGEAPGEAEKSDPGKTEERRGKRQERRQPKRRPDEGEYVDK